MSKKIFEKKEIIYAVVGFLIILSWFLYFKDALAPHLENLFPFFAMVIYQSGLYLGLFFLASILNGAKLVLKTSAISFCILLGVDIISAPYFVSKSGELITSMEYWYAMSDSGFASLYNLFLPQSIVWFMTYIFTPLLLMVIIPVIIGNSKQISKLLSSH